MNISASKFFFVYLPLLDLTKILYYLNDLTLNQATLASAGNPFMVDNLVVVCDGAEFCMRWPV